MELEQHHPNNEFHLMNLTISLDGQGSIFHQLCRTGKRRKIRKPDISHAKYSLLASLLLSFPEV